ERIGEGGLDGVGYRRAIGTVSARTVMIGTFGPRVFNTLRPFDRVERTFTNRSRVRVPVDPPSSHRRAQPALARGRVVVVARSPLADGTGRERPPQRLATSARLMTCSAASNWRRP